MQVAEGTRRVLAIDVARGIAVIGVVFNHAVDGVVGAGILPYDSPLSVVNRALYILRMPALAFLVGVFIPMAVSRRGAGGYARSRAASLLYLYVIWFFLQGAVELASSGVKNKPFEPYQLLTLWAPIGHLWFLPFAVAAGVLTAYARPWGRNRLRRGVALGATVGVSVALWAWNPDVVGLKGMSLLAFVAAGAAVGVSRLGRFVTQSVRRWMAVGAVALSAFLLLRPADLVPATQDIAVDWALKWSSMAAASLGIVVLLAVAVFFSRVPRVRDSLAAVGTRTLPIYLAHLIVVGGVRVVLQRMGVDSPGLLVAAAVAMGVGLPLVLHVVAKGRPQLSWLFDRPTTWGRADARP